MFKDVGIEQARKNLGELVNEVRYTHTSITLTRNGKPVARLVPVETVGARCTVPEYSVPEDWTRSGEIVEVNEETVVVELDDGHRQELPTDEVTITTEK